MVLKKQKNIKKVTIHKNGQKITQNSFPGETDRSENNFMHFDHQDNTFQRSKQSFQTNYCISLRNGKIYKETDKQTI